MRPARCRFSVPKAAWCSNATPALRATLTQTLEPSSITFISRTRPEPDPEFRERHAGHQFRDDLYRKPVQRLRSHQRCQPVTMGLSSRFLNATTGSNACAWAWPALLPPAARVTLRACRAHRPKLKIRPARAISGAVAPHWTAEGGWRYNTELAQTQQLNIGTRYQPQPGKTLNLSYRYTVDALKQTDISAQWRYGASGLLRALELFGT